MASTTFMDRSRSVSERFLQTAVVVDDQPHYLREPQRLQELRPEDVISPSRRSAEAVQVEGEDSSLERPSKNDLRAKLLVDSFASRGIVCAILQPVLTDNGTPGEREEIQEVESRADLATQRADIVVLDWNLRGDAANPGGDAKAIIKAILETDNPGAGANDGIPASRRLRLIAVYTGEVGLSEITSELHMLAVELELPNPKLGSYRVEAGPVMFVVYGKEGGTIQDPSEDGERRVSERDLPERLLTDFTTQTSGLLSNVTLASLSAVRDNTHRILSRFSPQVDAPYVSHRAMMEPPEEAAEHPVPLVAAEIEGVLAGASQIPELVSTAAIAEWLEQLRGINPGQGLDLDFDDFKTRLLDLLSKGLRKHEAEEGKWAELAKRLRDYKDREAAERTIRRTYIVPYSRRRR